VRAHDVSILCRYGIHVNNIQTTYKQNDISTQVKTLSLLTKSKKKETHIGNTEEKDVENIDVNKT